MEMAVEDQSSARLQVIAEVLQRLYEADFSLSSIGDTSGLQVLLTPLDLSRIEREAYLRFKKYIARRVVGRGERYDTAARLNVWKGMRKRLYVDRFVRAALCHLGITGSQRIDYNRIAYKLMGRLKGKLVDEWPRILEGSRDLWEGVEGLDPRAAKIVATLTAKILYQLEYGNLRLPYPTREELYPERADDYAETFKERPTPSLEEPEEGGGRDLGEVVG